VVRLQSAGVHTRPTRGIARARLPRAVAALAFCGMVFDAAGWAAKIVLARNILNSVHWFL
jgi:hypothetical protein